MRTTGRFPVPCGQLAHYKELRSKTVLTVLGPVKSAAYYACACSKGQYPADAELGVVGLESSHFSDSSLRRETSVNLHTLRER